MESFCTRCGQICAEPGAQFCPSCGGRLELRPATASTEPVAPLPPPAPELGAELAGARCSAHPDVPARNVCSRCGNFACAACVRVDLEGKPHCASCANWISLDRWDVPWERRATLGLFQGYWQTAKTASFEPQRAFVGLSPQGNWWDAMSYAMVSYALSIISLLVIYAVTFGAVAVFGNIFSKSDGPSPGIVVGIVVGVIVGIAVAIPLGTIIRVYIGAGIDHLALMIFGGGKAGFDATFRSYCYAMSPAMFGLIPFCGLYIWEIWRIVICIIAYQKVHKMSGGRAAAAVLLPIGVCCGAYFGLIAFGQLAGTLFK